ncbi:MAG TPA: PEP-CTERM sorting domain-containing protein [Candidatus Eisenbacteria bacterium]|uniref:PEP-CTERM sorting domain-containing protein n=1 Tax=Eiseniibacteriota bacterium TaxID=2212470 RepID=A0A7V2F3A5_UNCEI|nr:PEP-CTERM sorting domain-containing protein [Candidatus Eisenbacteria bacterium]
MRNVSFAVIVALVIVCCTIPAATAPRLQTYIWQSSYLSDGIPDQGAWTTSRDNFFVTTAAYWQEFEIDDNHIARPAYDQIDCFLRIGVPRGETGSILINGISINSLMSSPPPTLATLSLGETAPDGFDYRYIRVGKLSNSYVGALHFDHGRIHEPGWGSMRSVLVDVSGYSSVLFGAAGLDRFGRAHINPGTHDARYCATPEPGTLSLLGLGLLGAVPFIRRAKSI